MTLVGLPEEVMLSEFQTSSPCEANSVFYPSEVEKWVSGNIEVSKCTMKVALINCHWWYVSPLSNCNPWIVDCIQVNYVNGIVWFRFAELVFLMKNIEIKLSFILKGTFMHLTSFMKLIKSLHFLIHNSTHLKRMC